ncbi:MAG: SH3 domain-containing protein [Patescibacteria group bacterium]|nr:SH3 domain-containing protein [Patescibacteria group bacterium]
MESFLGVDPNFLTPTQSPTPTPTLANPFLTPTPKEKSSPTISSSSKVVILDTPNGFLRVRDDASLSGAEIARVTPGETFPLLDESNGWYKIKLKDGTTGWVSSQFAEKQ